MKSSLTLVALAVAAFLATLLIMRPGADRSPAPHSVQAQVPAPRHWWTPQQRTDPRPDAPPAPRRSVDLPAAAVAEAGADGPSEPTPESLDSAPDLSAQFVPAVLTRRRPKGNAPGEAVIMNMSPATLTVQVTAVDADGRQTTAQMELPPNRKSGLADAGIMIAGPTTITLSSPPYRDLTAQME